MYCWLYNVFGELYSIFWKTCINEYLSSTENNIKYKINKITKYNTNKIFNVARHNNYLWLLNLNCGY